MSQTIQNIDPNRELSFARTALFDYALHIAGMVLSLGTLSLVALIINYIQRPRSRGTVFESHFTWMIRTCWWWLFWVVVLAIPVVLTAFLLAPIWVIPSIWYLYRMIKGVIWLNDRKPMPV